MAGGPFDQADRTVDADAPWDCGAEGVEVVADAEAVEDGVPLLVAVDGPALLIEGGSVGGAGCRERGGRKDGKMAESEGLGEMRIAVGGSGSVC